MGTFLTPDEVKGRVLPGCEVLSHLEPEDIDDHFIIPAERIIEQACCLNLNTDGYPWAWNGTFTSSTTNGVRQRDMYIADYKRCTLMVVMRMSQRPLGEAIRSIGGASSTYSESMVPSEVRVMMRKWGQRNRLIR